MASSMVLNVQLQHIEGDGLDDVLLYYSLLLYYSQA